VGRVNLTLDPDTENRLERHARASKTHRAALAREILREGLLRREERERRRKLARDYAAGRNDARLLLKEIESAQFDLLDDDDS
jgi:hypothetical protein